MRRCRLAVLAVVGDFPENHRGAGRIRLLDLDRDLALLGEAVDRIAGKRGFGPDGR